MDGHREEERLVEDDADVGPEAGQGEVPDVVAVDLHRAVPHVVEAGEQAGHRRLAGARPPDDGHRLARGDVQVEVGQHQLLGVLGVGEVDVAEPHVARAVDQVDGVGRIVDGGLLVQDLVDASADAAARCPIMMSIPSIMNGAWSMSR